MPAISDCVATYLAEVTPTKAPSTRRHDPYYARIVLEGLRNCEEQLLAGPLDASDIASLGPPEVDLLHRQIGIDAGHRTLANRVLSFVSEVCKLAERRGWRAANTNPTTPIRRYNEPRRTRFLHEKQRAAWIRGAREAVLAGEVTYSAALVSLLMLLAGLRWSSARGLLWSEVDLVHGTIRLSPRTEDRENKAGDETTIGLSDDVLELLRSTPRYCEYVAPNPATRRPYTDIRCALERIKARSGVPLFTPHMGRHSFGTALAEAGLTEAEIGALLGSTAANAQRYTHLVGGTQRRSIARAAAAVRGGATW